SDRARAASPTVSHLLATVVIDPSFESTAASALIAELLDFAVACRLALVAEFESASPPSVGGDCALGTDVLEDRQEEFEFLAAAVPHFASILLALEGDPDAPDIPTPLTQRRLRARYVARGFSQRQGVDYFQTFSPTPKMTTLKVLLHVAAQRDYELHSLDFSTTFLQGSLHEEIWLRRPPGFTGSFLIGTQWSLRRPVYGLRQTPHEWHDTPRTTLASLGFAPSIADPSLVLRTDTSLPPFYVLVYIDNLVFATADTEALTLVKSELQKRHTCTDLGELRSYLGLQITRDRARRTITLTQSHMVHQAPVVLTGHADASWVDNSVTQRSSQGYTFSLGSGSVSWRSTRSASVLSSSCEAEIYAGAMGAQELRWLTYLLNDLGEHPRSPPVLGPYAELVGCLMYLMTCTRPDLAFPLSVLARFVAPGRHRPVHWTAAVRVAKYLATTSGVGLVLGGRHDVVLTGHCDSSFADDAETHMSTQGYCFSLGSGAVSWRSTRSSSVSTSTAEAEIYAGAMAAQELRWLMFLLTDLSERPSSAPTLFTDNKATILLCQESRLESRLKHINAMYFLLRELQRRGQARFDFVESEANIADILTKALLPCDHQSDCTMASDGRAPLAAALPEVLWSLPAAPLSAALPGVLGSPPAAPLAAALPGVLWSLPAAPLASTFPGVLRSPPAVPLAAALPGVLCLPPAAPLAAALSGVLRSPLAAPLAAALPELLRSPPAGPQPSALPVVAPFGAVPVAFPLGLAGSPHDTLAAALPATGADSLFDSPPACLLAAPLAPPLVAPPSPSPSPVAPAAPQPVAPAAPQLAASAATQLAASAAPQPAAPAAPRPPAPPPSPPPMPAGLQPAPAALQPAPAALQPAPAAPQPATPAGPQNSVSLAPQPPTPPAPPVCSPPLRSCCCPVPLAPH
ncbi:unnamed protein product, partial [Closterium sp. NIES-54]